jgi:putative transposase
VPRPFRLEYPGACWHIHNRGVERRDIFLDDDDRRFFLTLLGEVAIEYKWRVFSYAEMTNHYHGFIQTIEPTLSRGMQALDGEFAARFNRRHRRCGPLFQGRFRAHLVEQESYLLEVTRYIVLNPVRARMVGTAGEWPWSSYRATAGLERAPEWLDTASILDRFDPSDRSVAMQSYREFVAAGAGQHDSPWEKLRAGLYLGSESFIGFIEELTATRKTRVSEPVSQRNVRVVAADTVRRIVESELARAIVPKSWKCEQARLMFALLARKESVATYSEIGSILGLSPPGARSLYARAEALYALDRGFRREVDRVMVTINQLKTGI